MSREIEQILKNQVVIMGMLQDLQDELEPIQNIEDTHQLLVDKNNGWIPCKERLPETLESKVKAYLTTNEEGMIGVSYYHHMCVWSNGYESVFDVIAWQPLPEPYREEQEDEQ